MSRQVSAGTLQACSEPPIDRRTCIQMSRIAIASPSYRITGVHVTTFQSTVVGCYKGAIATSTSKSVYDIDLTTAIPLLLLGRSATVSRAQQCDSKDLMAADRDDVMRGERDRRVKRYGGV